MERTRAAAVRGARTSPIVPQWLAQTVITTGHTQLSRKENQPPCQCRLPHALDTTDTTAPALP